MSFVLAILRGVLAKLTIHLRHAPEGTKVTVDGEPLGARKVGEAFLIPPGEVKLRAQTDDGRETSRQVSLFVAASAGRCASRADPSEATARACSPASAVAARWSGCS